MATAAEHKSVCIELNVTFMLHFCNTSAHMGSRTVNAGIRSARVLGGWFCEFNM